MPHIPLNLTDAKEMSPVKPGRYDLTITQVEETKTREKQKPQLRVSIAIGGHDDAPNINEYISLPAQGDEPKAFNFKKLLLNRFCTLFGLEFDEGGFDTDLWPGATASNVEVTMDEPNDKGQVFNRIVVPKLATEAAASAGASGRGAPPPPKR